MNLFVAINAKCSTSNICNLVHVLLSHLYAVLKLITKSRHIVVYQRPRKKRRCCSTQVCYLLVLQSCQIRPSVSPKLPNWFLPNFYIFCLTYTYTTSHIKIEENRFSFSWDIYSWKLTKFLHIFFFFFAQNYLSHV